MTYKISPLIIFLIFGTVSPSAQQATASQLTHIHLPGAIQECEDTAGCATWFFHGNKGYGQWKNGSIADAMLKIASFSFAGDMIKGDPVARDVPQAITWLKHAAHLGDTDAMESLAIIYLLGIPDPVNAHFPGSFDAGHSRDERGSTTRVGSECMP